MKPKTTLNLLKNFFAIEFKKHILMFLVIANKVQLRSGMLLCTFVFFLSSSITYSQSGSCKATLQVEKNRFTKSVPPEGITYSLQISNTGTSDTNYVLSSTNINNSCSNNDGSSSSGNVNLNISFTDLNKNAINQIFLNSGETFTFLVQIKVPAGTAVSKWNCTQITATAAECASYKVNTVLHTLVSDPNAE
jgi:uncharacterized membrane protein